MKHTHYVGEPIPEEIGCPACEKEEPANIRDYGLGRTDAFVRSAPRARLATPIENAAPICPVCQCLTIFEIEVDVDAPLLRGGKGVGRYLGCPACPWASPMLMTADAATGRKP